MFSYIASFVSKRTDHPVIFSTFLLAAVFLVLGIVGGQIADSGIVSGFMLIYAGFAALLGIIGYGVLYAGKFISNVRDKSDPT